MKGDSSKPEKSAAKSSELEEGDGEEKAPPAEDPVDEQAEEEISLPDPNIQDGDGSATYGNETSMARRVKEWGVEYEHPLDRFHAAPRQRKMGFSARLCLAIAFLVFGLILVGAGLAWTTTGRFVKQGYEVVRLTGTETVILKSPEVPTCYLGRSIDVRIPKCGPRVAFIGTNVTIRGDFLSDVSVTAFRLHVTKQARFAGDLEVYAGEFRDESATLLGGQRGFTLRDIFPPEDPEPTTP